MYPAINLLRFAYNQPRRGKFAVTAVLAGERDKMALIYEGRAGTNMLPFYLVRGESLPPELAPFATSQEDTAKYWKAQDAMQASVQALQEKALAYQELNNRLRAATRAGDTAAVGQIRKEIQALQQELRATREQQHVLQLR
jgi:5'-deoxynucleotidase YfbR-like HD superfamily hydrolase